MSISSKIKFGLVLAIALASLQALAATITPQIGGGIGFVFDGGIGGKPSVAIAQPTGKILLADGVSHLLLADGVSRLCRAGGC